MKWLGAIVLSMLVLVGVLTLQSRKSAVPGLGPDATNIAEEPSSGYSAERARLVQTNAAGAPLYVLQAASLTQEPDSQDVTAADLKLDYLHPETAAGSPWTLTAREGHLPGNTLQIRVAGKVRLIGVPPRSNVPLRIETTVLNFDIDKQVATTDMPVTFNWGTRRMNARGLNADLKRGTLRLESSVHGRIPP